MVNLYFIRHARQNSPLCNVDVELSKEGQLQAKLLKDRLTNFNIDALYSSDLLRAIETAEIINETWKLPHLIEADLKEISFGAMTGKTDQYNDEHFGDFKREQLKLKEDLPYPEGENGTQVFHRAFPVITNMLQTGNKNIAIVTHGGTIRAILAGLFLKDQAKRFLLATSLENTSITHLIYNDEIDRFYLERFNDHAHLEAHPNLLRKNR
ncbi:MAG: Phosphoglycerate mutase [Herbinix sp.]|jgi:probable phosphoglycerate mutase|nr:Phosphoglycerate mutase [Herbinix sp.]